ncbi:heparan-alpha-glucosaminide N-acetyltransferase [Chelativorans intermedius]|uniref:Heparan-alpha-glucosaminide N-acetyltransferase n=1 Tax=Chelativorans intermedius TaxID=515947 RepID=A0ABV6DCP0_9HYPH|nr:heparan-alpha-glucosaminide N-acetyltransferase [Chelativorans intermedius]MCT8998071.1 DUF1624 domain-containing protein [Chelativorans intermedius]
MTYTLHAPRAETSAGTRRARLIIIDVVRGLAIAGVVVYHLAWDLEFTGLVATGIVGHPAWIVFARTLAGTFMFLVGVNLVLAHRGGMRWDAFARRLGPIILAALAISIVTKFVFPDTFIYFGILHAIVAASVIGVFFLRLPMIFSLIGAALIFTIPFAFNHALFNSRWVAWIGFAEQVPPSNDFVPLFPWVGLTLLGIFLARFALAQSADAWLKRHEPPGNVARSLAWFGRHSLAIYLIHQPILLAVIIPLASWSR